MKISDNSFDEVAEMLHHVEEWVKNGKTTESKLAGIQKKIDAIDEEYRYDAAVDANYHQLYELQAIVYHLGGHKVKAKNFAIKALESGKPTSKLTEKIADSSYDEVQDKLESPIVDNSNPIRFFHRSPNAVFWLSLLTLNIYNIYWVYRQFRAIRDSTGEKMKPFWRAIFQIFYIQQLLKRIVDASNQYDDRGPWKGGVNLAAISYILAIFLGNAVGRAEVTSQGQEIVLWGFTFVLALLAALITKAAQNAANYHNVSVLGKNYDFRSSFMGKSYAGEVIIAVIGIIITLAAVLLSAYSFTQNTYPQGSTYEISAAKEKMDDLTSQYTTCSDSLKTRYATIDNTSQSEVDSYNADYASCENIRLEQNTAVTEYNRLAGFKTE